MRGHEGGQVFSFLLPLLAILCPTWPPGLPPKGAPPALLPISTLIHYPHLDSDPEALGSGLVEASWWLR